MKRKSYSRGDEKFCENLRKMIVVYQGRVRVPLAEFRNFRGSVVVSEFLIYPAQLIDVDSWARADCEKILSVELETMKAASNSTARSVTLPPSDALVYSSLTRLPTQPTQKWNDLK